MEPADEPSFPVPRGGASVPKSVEEAVTLTGTFVNNIAVGITITGGIAPPLGFLFGSLPIRTPVYGVIAVSALCVLAGIGLHFAGRRVCPTGVEPMTVADLTLLALGPATLLAAGFVTLFIAKRLR